MTESPPAISESPAGRLLFIDFLRGIAAIAVAVHHLREYVAPRYPDAVSTHVYLWLWKHFAVGSFGIAIFFIISGFLIPATLERPGAPAELRRATLLPALPALLAFDRRDCRAHGMAGAGSNLLAASRLERDDAASLCQRA